jgi:two-component system cell cycle sensor histidine kinase/response regulator CckA
MENKKTETPNLIQLQEALEQRNAVLNAIPDLMFLFDEEATIIDCHPRHFSPSHYTDPSQFLNQSVEQVLPAHVAELTRENIKKVLGGAEEAYSTYSLDISGEKQYFECRNVPCGERQVLAIVRNITERVYAEKVKDNLQKQLLQSHKMESIGRLAGGIAHDFNNMLGVIISHVEMALGECADNPRLTHHLMEVSHASERSIMLVKQLLSFARKQTISPKVIDLNSTIEQTLSMLRRMIGENIELIFKPEEEAGLVFIDPAQIDQILTNLSINARDAIASFNSTGRGKVLIETQRLTIDASYSAQNRGFLPGEYIVMTVCDTGCGMDEKTVSQVFEPFFTTKAFNQGTGLGLAMVYGIVKQNQGFIHVYSEPRKGTSFKVYLPRHTDEVAPHDLHTIPISKEPQGGNEKLLLVEDEPMLIRVTAQVLENLGYEVLTARNAEEAMEIAKQHDSIDLIVTDIVMPGMNGKELSDALSLTHPDTKVLFMSGYTANIIEQHGILDSSVHFISKPCSTLELSSKIRYILDHSD